MRTWFDSRAAAFWALAALPLFSGCAAVIITGASVGAAGAGRAVSEGVSYSFSSTFYRSFTFPQDKVHAAALQALQTMQITLKKDEIRPPGYRIQAATKDLKITVTLYPLTPNLTQIGVSAKKRLVMRDLTVAAEIMVQTEKILGSTL